MSHYELPVVTPESVGISSDAIARFLKRLEAKRLPMHSVLMVRDGKLAFETYWKPFHRDFKHRMYSVSKSFTSAAIGMLAGEGKLSLDDPIAKFFPDKAPADLHPWIAQTTIRHALMMTLPFTDQTYRPTDPDWADTFFNTPPSHLPGQVFHYNTTATDMMCSIIKRVSGQELSEYLRERFFEPAGMNTDIWCVKSPCDHEWGGSGIMATSRDLAKFALVFLNEGRAGDRQIVPADYARAAVSKQVDNSLHGGDPEFSFGYGYQFWRTRHGWMCYGMGSQFALVVPEYNFICVTNGDTQALPQGVANVLESLWEEILPCLQAGDTLPEEPVAHQALLDTTANQELLCCKGAKNAPIAAQISGKTWKMFENPLNLKWVRMCFDGEEGVWEYENATGVHAIRFGFGHQVKGVFPETHYYGTHIGHPSGEGYECHASAGWMPDGTLLLFCYTTGDYFGLLKVAFRFEEERMTLFSGKTAEWFLDEYVGFASGEAE